MSVRPIDLQTLFSHLNQVGREQAHEKNAAVLQQAQHGQEMVKNAEEADHHINEAEKTEDGLESIKDEKEEKPPGGDSGAKEKEEEKKDEKKPVYFKDPDLGHNIDITG